MRTNAGFYVANAIAKEALKTEGMTVRIIVQSPSSDGLLAEAVFSELESIHGADRLELIVPDGPKEFAEAIRNCSVMVAGRLHSCILGLGFGVPVIGIFFDEHGHKMPGLFRSLGIENWAVRLDLKREDFDVSEDVHQKVKLALRGDYPNVALRLEKEKKPHIDGCPDQQVLEEELSIA